MVRRSIEVPPGSSRVIAGAAEADAGDGAARGLEDAVELVAQPADVALLEALVLVAVDPAGDLAAAAAEQAIAGAQSIGSGSRTTARPGSRAPPAVPARGPSPAGARDDRAGSGERDRGLQAFSSSRTLSGQW
jgi:hypothetical protein